VQWPEGCKLIFERGDGDLLGETKEFPIPAAAPGQKVTVGAELPVPKKTSGRRKAHFRLVDGQRNVFGEDCWIDVEIVDDSERKCELKEAPAVAVPVAQPAPVVAPVAAKPAPAPAAPAPVRVEPPAAVPVPIPVRPEAKAEQPKPAANKSAPPPQFKAQLDILARMGFETEDLNIYLLNKSGGDLEQVINWLLETKKFT